MIVYPGLGSNTGDQQIVGTVGAVATPVAGALLGGTVATLLGTTVAVAVPIIGAAILGATLAINYLIKNSGCGVTCVETSEWANQAEPLLRNNLNAYLQSPPPRNQAEKDQALGNFDSVWATLQQQCGQQGTGNAGVRCISDRQSGACKWHDASGQCWNWFSGYRDPIANDPISIAVPNVSSIMSNPMLLVGGVAVVMGLMAMGKD